jgi:activator of HSP90 ATPase
MSNQKPKKSTKGRKVRSVKNLIMNLRTLQQNVTIEGASPAELFDVFIDPEKHGDLIGAKVTGNGKQGSKFTAFDGFVTGVNLLIVPERLLVQSWRGSVWEEDDLDSILILHFNGAVAGAQIQMVHAGLPPQFQERWEEFYWQPMKKLFSHKRQT